MPKVSALLGYLLLCVCATTSSARALYVYHDAYEYFVNAYDDFSYVYTGQLRSNCLFGDLYSGITNEMWRYDPDGQSWTEMGDMEGELNSQCWNAGFAAYQTPNGYQEIALVPFRPWVGWHSFEINGSGNTVMFYYNGNNVATYLGATHV